MTSAPGGEAVDRPLPVLPGFREMALRRMAGERRRMVAELAARRQAAGLSQTQVAARMGTSQSAVARIEAGAAGVRASTLERYAAAVGSQLSWRLAGDPAGSWPAAGPAGLAGGSAGPGLEAGSPARPDRRPGHGVGPRPPAGEPGRPRPLADAPGTPRPLAAELRRPDGWPPSGGPRQGGIS